MDVDQFDELLNRNSGLKGLSGVNDFRELDKRIEAGDARAKLAYEVYVHRLRKYVGACLAVLGRVDAIAFTAGVGENAANVREDTLSGLEGLGIAVDRQRNRSPERSARLISSDTSSTTVLVMRPTRSW
jgi:acetate kinase